MCRYVGRSHLHITVPHALCRQSDEEDRPIKENKRTNERMLTDGVKAGVEFSSHDRVD